MVLPDLLSGLLRGLGFIALLQAGGAALFLALPGRALRASPGEVRRLIRVAAILAAVLLVAQYLLEPARMAGAAAGVLDPALRQMVLHSPATIALLARLAALVLLVWAARTGATTPIPAGIIAAVVIAGSFAAVGHASGRWALSLLLALHLLSVQYWFGSLRPLRLAARVEDAAVTARVIERFSRGAMWMVPLILIAGVLLVVGIVPRADALLGAYGAGLLGKVLVFAVLLAFAAFNKWRLTPALAGRAPGVLRKLERNIRIEYWLIAMVLMGTAFLTLLWSPEA